LNGSHDVFHITQIFDHSGAYSIMRTIITGLATVLCLGIVSVDAMAQNSPPQEINEAPGASGSAYGRAAVGQPSAASKLEQEISEQRILLKQQQEQLAEQQLVLERLQSEMEAQKSGNAKTKPAARKVEAASLAGAGPAKASGISVAFHGFVNVTAFTQSQSFLSGNGQQAEWPTPGSGGNRNISGVQLNNSKLAMDVSGASLPNGWDLGGHIETDFFGGYNGTGPLSYEQPEMRLRLAYMKMDHPDTGTSLIVGQYWTLFSSISNGNNPTTMSHIAFPLGAGIGNMGWRYPGIVVLQQLGHPSKGSAKWHLDAAVYTGTWNGPGSNVALESAGNVGFRPQVMARLRVEKGKWSAYVAGLHSSADLRGVSGSAPQAPAGYKNTISTHAVQVGGMWNLDRLHLVGAVYKGKGGLGAVATSLGQFGDIRDHGGWVQAVYSFTEQLEASLMYSTSRPDKDDVVRWMGHGSNGLFNGQQATAGIFWNRGPFGLGMELMRARVDKKASSEAPTITTFGNWMGFSSIYRF
jgi:hypothetical protein